MSGLAGQGLQASQITTGVVVGVAAIALGLLARMLSRQNDKDGVSVGPLFVLAAVVLLCLYGLGSLVDVTLG